MSCLLVYKLLFVKQLRGQTYEELRKEIIALVEEGNPRVALNILSRDTGLAQWCHPLTHELGRYSLKKYKDFGETMKYNDEFCNAGYMHGVLEEYFLQKNDPSSMHTFCSRYEENTYLSWACYHGMGHGIMYYTGNDLPKSLVYCSSYNDIRAEEYCLNGVFMENFNSQRDIHPTRFVNPNKPEYPCNTLATSYKKQCYVFAASYYLTIHRQEYKEALEWCEKTVRENNAACAAGVGRKAASSQVDNPEMIEPICLGASEEVNKKSCIMGFVTQHIYHWGSAKAGEKLCNKLSEYGKNVCLKVVADHSVFFN